MSPADSPAGAKVAPTRSAGRTQARGDRTRAAIIDETVRCVNEEGFAAASANHIADRAGVTWGVIQYHFGDRNGLLSAVVTHGFQRFRSAIDAIAVPEGPDHDRVVAVVEAAWTAFADPDSRASLEILIATRAGRDPTQTAELVAMGREMRKLGRVLVGKASAERADASVVGEVLWAALRGLVFAQILSDRPVDSRAERAVLVDLITTYLSGRVAPAQGR